jgi:hypothetical protein
MNAMRLSLLLVVNAGFIYAEDPEQSTPSYAEYFDDGDPYGVELERPPVEKDTPTKRHAKVGNAKVTVEVKNIDKLSESEKEWDRIRPKSKKPQEKKKSRFRDDKEEEDDDDSASVSIKWRVSS